LEKVRSGELDDNWSWAAEEGLEKEIRFGNDQTWILASSEPERMKLHVGSTTREVTGCKCEADVES
jgi:hypothetical protein